MADSQAPVIVIAFCAIYAFCLGSFASPDGAGFSVELIHRDSPRSPLHDPAETPAQRFENAVRRSISRANRFSSAVSASGSEPYAELRPDEGVYLMEISIGTPPGHIVGIADTGSDLTWTQCLPCNQCFKQAAPLFDPNKSSTYRDISCSSVECSVVPKTCTNGSGPCQYSITYGGGIASTEGNLAMDTVTLGSTSSGPFVLPQTIIGCGHKNNVPFDEKTSGIIGLGGGPASLASQLGKAIGRRLFSYCLVQYNVTTSSSRLNFGSKAAVTGPGTVSTPLSFIGSDFFYYLNLKAVSVDTIRVEYEASSGSASKGNIVIDSGTALTVLAEDFYNWMESAVAKRIALSPMKNPPFGLKLCYNSSSDIKAPVITFHFEGADVTLDYMNTFIRVDRNVLCFAFLPTTGFMYIYGNSAQTNFRIGYDQEKETVSFKPTDCTKYN